MMETIPTPTQTEAVKKVLSLAEEEAHIFQHDYIGTEHLLLGLICEGDGIAAKSLSKLGVEAEKLRDAVKFLVKQGDDIGYGQLRFTQRATDVMAQALSEARQLKHDYIGIEHVLLGLTRVDESIAQAILQSMGIRMEQVRSAVSEEIK
jgi:ATP-dependent Clp protease ATP-binding subunit ClpC